MDVGSPTGPFTLSTRGASACGPPPSRASQPGVCSSSTTLQLQRLGSYIAKVFPSDGLGGTTDCVRNRRTAWSIMRCARAVRVARCRDDLPRRVAI